MKLKRKLRTSNFFKVHPQIFSKTFFQEVPEIYEGTIEIKSVARDPEVEQNLCILTRFFN